MYIPNQRRNNYKIKKNEQENEVLFLIHIVCLARNLINNLFVGLHRYYYIRITMNIRFVVFDLHIFIYLFTKPSAS